MDRTDRRRLLTECEQLTAQALQLADRAEADMAAVWLTHALAAITAEVGDPAGDQG